MTANDWVRPSAPGPASPPPRDAETTPAVTPAAPAPPPAPSAIAPLEPVRHRTSWPWLSAILLALLVFGFALGEVNARMDGTTTLAAPTRVPLDANGLTSAVVPADWSTDIDALIYGYGDLRGDGLSVAAITGTWIGDFEGLGPRVLERIVRADGPRFADGPAEMPFALTEGVDGELYVATNGARLYLMRNSDSSDVVALLVRPDGSGAGGDAASAPVLALAQSVEFSDGKRAGDA